MGCGLWLYLLHQPPQYTLTPTPLRVCEHTRARTHTLSSSTSAVPSETNSQYANMHAHITLSARSVDDDDDGVIGCSGLMEVFEALGHPMSMGDALQVG